MKPSTGNVSNAMLKRLLRKIVPSSVYEWHWAAQRARRERAKASAQTTEEIFTEIYRTNRWGGAPGTFYSGSGSDQSAIVEPYVEAVRAWLREAGAVQRTVVDLGCGDFRVGSRLADVCGHYIGVDIVSDLVRANTAAHAGERVEFRHLDITRDPLPAGEICLLRQVLQHLSNAEIQRVLPKLKQYQWLAVTEHQPSPGRLRRPNADKVHGADVRVGRGSGVYLEEPPFTFGRPRMILEVPGDRWSEEVDPGFIRTFVFHHPPMNLLALPPPPPGRSGWPWTAEAVTAGASPLPRISVVTPSYQQGEFLEMTIRSVLLQGYPHLEYIVMDGGSTDESVEILKKYGPWLTHWESRHDQGQTDAVNQGLSHCTGEIVAYLNSDDWYHPGALRAIGERSVQHPEETWWAGWVDNRSDETGSFVRKTSRLTGLVAAMGRRDIVHQPGVFWKRSLHTEAGVFDLEMHFAFDHEFWIRLFTHGARLTNLPVPVANFRLHGKSKSCSQEYRFMPEIWRIAERYRNQVSAGEWREVARSLRDAEGDILVCNAYSVLINQGRWRALSYLMAKLRLLPHVRPPMTYLGALLRVLLSGRPAEWYLSKAGYHAPAR